MEGPGVGGVGYGTASMGVAATSSQLGVEGAGDSGVGVGYGTSAIGATSSMEGEFGQTTTTTNIEGNGLASTIQSDFLPNAYSSTVENPLEQQIPA